MKQQKDREFDQKLAEMMKEHRVEAPEELWAAIDGELHPAKTKMARTWIWAAASLIAVLLIIGAIRWGKNEKKTLPLISANVTDSDTGGVPLRSPTVIIRNRDTGTVPSPKFKKPGIEPDGKDSVHKGFEFKPVKQPVKLSREVYAKTTDKIKPLKPVDQKNISALRESAQAVILAKNTPKASINDDKILLKVIIEDDKPNKLDINNLNFVNALNILTSKLDRSNDKFLHLEKGENNEKVKGFSLDIVNITITYNGKN